MRISEVASLALVGLQLGLVPAAMAFDGNQVANVPSGPATALSGALSGGGALDILPGGGAGSPRAAGRDPTPVEAFRSGTQAYRKGEKVEAVSSLQYAAEKGHPLAQWKLGRMYADGDGVPQDDLRAFEYFSRIASSHAEDSPGTAQARFVANAFVALGHYYRDGIPNSALRANPARAREMYSYAASYFGDSEAQYCLGRLYLEGTGTQKDPRLAARWFGLAANKGQYRAQALLGSMLFKGEHVQRQAARGLMWLALARDSAGAQEGWIADLYDDAFRDASEDERGLALHLLEDWLKRRRD